MLCLHLYDYLWLDNGLCSKRRFFQFTSKSLYFTLFTRPSISPSLSMDKNYVVVVVVVIVVDVGIVFNTWDYILSLALKRLSFLPIRYCTK